MTRWLLIGCLALAGLFGGSMADHGQSLGRLLLRLHLPGLALEVLEAPEWRGMALYQAGRYDEAAAAFWSAGGFYAFNRGDALARAGHYGPSVEAFETAIAGHPEDTQATTNKMIVEALLAQTDGGKGASNFKGSAATQDISTSGGDRTGKGGDNSGGGTGTAGHQGAGSVGETTGGSKVSRAGEGQQGDAKSGQGQAHGAAGDAAGVGQTSITDAVIAAQIKKASLRVRGKNFEAQEAAVSRQWLETLTDDPGRYLKLRLRAEHTRRIVEGMKP